MPRDPRTPRARAELRDLRRGLLWVSPWIIGFLLFFATPALLSLVYSFCDVSLLESPVYVGLANYRELTADPMLAHVVRNTLVYALASVLLSTVLTIAVAVLLEQPLRGREFVRAVVFLPTLVPAVSAAVAWLWLYNPGYGLINSALRAVGLRGPDWLGSPALALPSLIFMSLWVIGSSMTVCTAALRDVPRSLYEAADLDGVGPWRRLRHVTLPMISPAVLFNAVMALIWSMQFFAAPYIMTDGGPQNTTYSYSMYVYFNAFYYGRMGYASALAWLQVLAILALTVLVLRSTRGMVYYRAS